MISEQSFLNSLYCGECGHYTNQPNCTSEVTDYTDNGQAIVRIDFRCDNYLDDRACDNLLIRRHVQATIQFSISELVVSPYETYQDKP